MNSDDLFSLCLVQSDIDPVNVQANLNHYSEMLAKMTKKPDLVVFPEMFNSGFSSHIDNLAENMDGQSVQFLQDLSKQIQTDVVASMAIRENEKIYNRLLWISPDGIKGQYDKSHLYFGDEKAICTAGTQRITVTHEGITFLPLICYEIRFPLWCRNHYQNENFFYDCLLFIANFPAQRSETLEVLARARAIENQAYVIVVNRIGKDGNENPHKGNSMVIDPLGDIKAIAPENKEFLLEVTIDRGFPVKLRQKFPVYKDWDSLHTL